MYNITRTYSQLFVKFKMNLFRFCRSVDSSKDDFLNNVGQCELHEKPTNFICLQSDEKCAANRLLCLVCLEEHKTHNWEPLQKYFDENFRKAIHTGTSSIAKEVDDVYDTTLTEVNRLKAKINRKLDEIESDLQFQMKELKEKYPLKGKFDISGKQLNQRTAQDFVDTRERERNSEWTIHATNFITKMFRQTSLMMSNILDDFHMNIVSQDWEQITKQSAEKRVEEFLKKYEGNYRADPHYFKFSSDHLPGIRVNAEMKQIKFVKASPSKPTILVQNVMNKWHNIIYFQVMQLDKTILVFDKQLIALGVCLPKTAKAYGFRGIIEPSHGGFTIGSNGRCYHSKLFKYQKANSGITFGEEDIIKIELDYQEKKIKFQKITGLFKKKFEMELGIEDEEIAQLKPCVMFHGEEGAKVTILQEFETTKKYQKNKKKKRKIEDSSKK